MFSAQLLSTGITASDRTGAAKNDQIHCKTYVISI